jgi:hypothetical protein
MQEVISFGKRLVPLEQIAYVEPFNPAQNPQLNATKEFKARVVLINRDTVLAEANPHELAEAHGLRYLDEDNIAVNPAVAFRVETFAATDDFKPEKAFRTRLKWRDQHGKEQSKLLLTGPDAVIATVLRGEAEKPTAGKVKSQRPATNRVRRSSSRKIDSARP